MQNSPETSRPLIHLGIPKTATTTLQVRLFANEKSFHNVGKPDNLLLHRSSSSFEGRFIESLIWHSDHEAAPAMEKLRQLSAQAVTRGRRMILSDERLSYVNVPISLHERIAHRIRQACPDAQILISIREQRSLLQSVYLQSDRMMYAALGWPRDVPKRLIRKRLPFNVWLDALLCNPTQTFAGVTRYAQLSDIYEGVFGKESVFLVPFETMFQQPSPALLELLGVSEEMLLSVGSGFLNESRKKASSRVGGWHLQRQLDPEMWLRSTPEPIWRFYERALSIFSTVAPPISVKWKPEQVSKLAALVAEENAAVSTNYSLPLEKLGYLM